MKAVAVPLLVTLATGPAAADHRTLWLHDIHRGDEIRLQPFGPRGVPDRLAWARLTRFFRSRHDGRRAVHPRLLRVLAQIQRHFGGRRIDLLSGYREPDNPEHLSSYHQVGRGADIGIPGVANRDLFEYCRQIENLGCGLYPNGYHVHVDVRSRATIWVDLSGYGDGAEYVEDPVAWLSAHPDAGQ